MYFKATKQEIPCIFHAVFHSEDNLGELQYLLVGDGGHTEFFKFFYVINMTHQDGLIKKSGHTRLSYDYSVDQCV